MKREPQLNAACSAALVAGGAAAGCALTYLLDPARGKRRRTLARDRMGHVYRRCRRSAEGMAEHGLNHLRGFLAEARARCREEQVPDDVLEERVRSKLGHLASHPEGIEVQAREGCLTLHGWALAGEAGRIVRGAAKVRGVRSVESGLWERQGWEPVGAAAGSAATTGNAEG